MVSWAPSSRALNRSAPRYTASAPLATAARTASSEPAGASSSGTRRAECIGRNIALRPHVRLYAALWRVVIVRNALLHEPEQERGDDERDADPANNAVLAADAIGEDADAGECTGDFQNRHAIHRSPPRKDPRGRRITTRVTTRPGVPAREPPRQGHRASCATMRSRTPCPARPS